MLLAIVDVCPQKTVCIAVHIPRRGLDVSRMRAVNALDDEPCPITGAHSKNLLRFTWLNPSSACTCNAPFPVAIPKRPEFQGCPDEPQDQPWTVAFPLGVTFCE